MPISYARLSSRHHSLKKIPQDIQCYFLTVVSLGIKFRYLFFFPLGSLNGIFVLEGMAGCAVSDSWIPSTAKHQLRRVPP